MTSRKDKTLELHRKGYNCCQAVACTYCDLVGLDEKTAFRATEAFGAGMGGRKATCGAISAAVFLAGLKNSDADINAPKSKADTYKLSKEIIDNFLDDNGTAICEELKKVNDKTGKPNKSCDELILEAAEIAEKLLFSK